MRVITFYSYKGGVGRTLACANFGLYLAKTGQKVVLADMDFEAPGLDSKFPTVDISQCRSGMLDQFSAFQSGTEIPEIHAMEIPLSEDVARSGGSLRLMPAGNYLSPDYYPKLSSLHWDTFLREEPGLAFCIDLVKRIEKAFGADVLVIDSRTGLTELGGLCTQVFPDTVLLFTCTSPESLAGTKRIYERISSSPIVSRRLAGRTQLDLRIVVARIPRPDDLPTFDERMKERLGIKVTRLYYLFEQRDLSVEEYLALDRFVEERPAILDDYVELFASFHPELTLPYVEKRLTGFRSEVTRRSPQENERLIQELLTLFPRSEVFLEGARYYRLAKGGDAQAVANYTRYLDRNPDDANVVSEFAELCGSVPEPELKPRERILAHLNGFGLKRMDARLLERYCNLAQDGLDWQEVVKAIEEDESKLRSRGFRRTYFRALHALQDWKKIVDAASEKELDDPSMRSIIAEAHASLNNIAEVGRLLSQWEVRDPNQAIPFLRIIYKIKPDANIEQIEDIARLDEKELHVLFHFLRRRGPIRIGQAPPGFGRWLRDLLEESSVKFA